MTIAPLLQRMIEAGTPADIVADVAAALAAAEAKAAAAEATAAAKAETIEQRRQADRERKAAQRSRQKSGNVTGLPRKSQEKSDPPKSIYQTPRVHSGAIAPASGKPPADAEPSLNAKVFETGVRILTAAGTAKARARAIVGLWRKQFGDPAVFEALAAAEREAASDPIAFITATLETRHDNRASAHQARQHGSRSHRQGAGAGEINPHLAAGLARLRGATLGGSGGGDQHDPDERGDPLPLQVR